MSLSALDLVIVVLIAASALLSLFRGFLYEFVSLLSCLSAIWVATRYAGRVAPWLPAAMDDVQFGLGATELQLTNLRAGVAFALLLVAVLILGGVVNRALSRWVLGGSLSLMDRVLGLGFGVLRGGLIVVILIVVAGLTPLPQTSWWSDSRLVGSFEPAAVWLVRRLPGEYGAYFLWDRRPG